MIRVNQVDCTVPTTEPPLPPSKACDRRFLTSTFELQSDNHPENYDPHLRCAYTVSRAHAGVCALELTFISFDVEASEGCQYDYLKLQDERLCGIYPANLKSKFEFSETNLFSIYLISQANYESLWKWFPWKHRGEKCRFVHIGLPIRILGWFLPDAPELTVRNLLNDPHRGYPILST